MSRQITHAAPEPLVANPLGLPTIPMLPSGNYFTQSLASQRFQTLVLEGCQWREVDNSSFFVLQ